MKCPFCDYKNANSAEICESCGQMMYQSKDVAFSTKHFKLIARIIIFFIFGPFFLGGLILLITGLLFTSDENEKVVGYDYTTPAILKGYDNCEVSDGYEFCAAIYEYEVDGKTYQITTDVTGTKGTYKNNETIYYKLEDPANGLIKANWQDNSIFGGILAAIFGILLVFGNILVNIIAGKKENIVANVKTPIKKI